MSEHEHVTAGPRLLSPRGMVTIRADFSELKTGDAVAAALGPAFPDTNCATNAKGRSLLWMSPDELLLICPAKETEALIVAARDALSRLPGGHHLVVDVSDARVAFEIEGAGARDVLARLTPADLRPGVFDAPQLRRTRLSQVAAAIWQSAPDRFEILCFRSVAGYVARLLEGAAGQGAPVGHLDRDARAGLRAR